MLSSSLAIIASFWGIFYGSQCVAYPRFTKIYVKGVRAPGEWWVSRNNWCFVFSWNPLPHSFWCVKVMAPRFGYKTVSTWLTCWYGRVMAPGGGYDTVSTWPFVFIWVSNGPYVLGTRMSLLGPYMLIWESNSPICWAWDCLYMELRVLTRESNGPMCWV